MDIKTTVVSKHKGGYDLYVGRGSDWGNPFSDNPQSKADHIVKPEEVMPMFRKWFQDRVRNEQGFAGNVLKNLHGKVLGCYCEGGKPCHGAIMASWADLLAEKWDQFKHDQSAMRAWLKNAPYEGDK